MANTMMSMTQPIKLKPEDVPITEASAEQATPTMPLKIANRIVNGMQKISISSPWLA